MIAKSIKGKSTQEVLDELENAQADGFVPTLAIVFLSVQQDQGAIVDLLDKHSIQVFGATTSGEFTDGDIEEGSCVILLLDMKPEHFKIIFKETGTHTTLENAVALGAEGIDRYPNPAFIIASGWVSKDGEEIVEGITQGFGGEVTIFGGMAGDDLKLEGPIVFTNKFSSDQGLLGLVINQDKIEINGIATCGWKPIGTTKTITRSEGNIVYTIDDKPALDLILKYLGVEYNFDSGKEIVTQVGAYYPLQMEREGVAPVMRTAMFANRNDRSLICAGNVPQGSKVRFSLPPDFDAIEKVIEECEALKKEKQHEADALIMISCVSRHLSFGILLKEEIERVQQVWGAPMAGFFSYGEYGKSKTGKHEFHNNTCCVVALKEK
ncbi:MAG: FIST N-terminal domain-containing protein [Ferruginibacter sp.]